MKNNSQEEYYKRESDLLGQEGLIIFSNPELKNEVKNIRERWQIPMAGLKSPAEIEEWHRNLDSLDAKNICHNRSKTSPSQEFLNDVTSIMLKFNIDPNYFNGVKGFVLTNNSNLSGVFLGPVIQTSKDERTGQPTLKITNLTNFSKKDVSALLHSLEVFRGKLPYKRRKKIRKIKNLDDYVEAVSMKAEGKNGNEIAERLSNDEKTLIYTDAHDCLRKYKKINSKRD